MYHITDIKQFNNCPKKYHLKSSSKEYYLNIFRNDYEITEILKNYFEIKTCYVGNVGDDPKLVLENLDKYEYFINPRFEFNGLRVKVTLLHKEDQGYSIYIFKPIIPKEIDDDSLYITFDVLLKNGIYINNIYYIYANKDYIFKDNFDYKKCILLTDTFNDNKLIEIANNHSFDYVSTINKINNYKPDNNIVLSKNCVSCEYFNVCHSIDDDSILHLVSSKYKFDMYNNGVKCLKDANISLIDGTNLQYAQIMASNNGGLFIDKNRIKTFTQSINSDVISFVDFEWDSYLFPKYNGMKCFSPLVFEYSLYVKKDNKITNYSFLGSGDCRLDFIESLINNLPETGPIIAYNSFSAETLRLQELAEYYPKYKDTINNIINRFVDIAEIFSKGMLYDIRFGGQLTLKKVAAVLSDISYKELNVKDGLEAVRSYRKYESTNNPTIKDDLIKYCNQDAYCLVVIYNYLINLI